MLVRLTNDEHGLFVAKALAEYGCRCRVRPQEQGYLYLLGVTDDGWFILCSNKHGTDMEHKSVKANLIWVELPKEVMYVDA